MQFHLIQVFDDPEVNFKGNTSTVIFLDKALSDAEMQSIAADQLQPATTFLWAGNNSDEFYVRWFAPDAEIGLCGHGSMAAIAFLNDSMGRSGKSTLVYRTGKLEVEYLGNSKGKTTFEQIPIVEEVTIPEVIREGLGIPVLNMYATTNKHIILSDSEDSVRNMKPDFSKLRESNIFGYAITAAGNEVDFVSRTLVPHVHQLEDPATGSSHAALFPFWGSKLNKTNMKAYQLSSRGGSFEGILHGDRVSLTGHFKTLAKGELL